MANKGASKRVPEPKGMRPRNRRRLLRLEALCAAAVVTVARGAPSHPGRTLVTQSAAAALSVRPYTLSMEISLVRGPGQQEQPLHPGELAHSGETFVLRLWVDQPAYVYAVRCSQQDAPAFLFPQTGSQLIQPGRILRLPLRQGAMDSAVAAYKLDGRPGTEQLRAYATLRPLAEPRHAQLAALCASAADSASSSDEKRESSGRPTKPAPDQNKAGRKSTERDFHPRGEQAGSAAVMRSGSGDRGTVLLAFSFRHVP
ncbi:MAG: DUF4384 domain-containing protein [Polyangia bacterium]